MGLSLFGSSNKSNVPNAEYFPPEPNPAKYEILREAVINGKSVLLVRYPGCTTFDGTKLLLLKHKWNINSKVKLDPHLLGGNHPVIARFEPTDLGWTMARECAYIF